MYPPGPEASLSVSETAIEEVVEFVRSSAFRHGSILRQISLFEYVSSGESESNRI